MATITETSAPVQTVVEVTPDYCFSQAAEALTPTFGGRPGGTELAAEWRQLGLAIHSVTITPAPVVPASN